MALQEWKHYSQVDRQVDAKYNVRHLMVQIANREAAAKAFQRKPNDAMY